MSKEKEHKKSAPRSNDADAQCAQTFQTRLHKGGDPLPFLYTKIMKRKVLGEGRETQIVEIFIPSLSVCGQTFFENFRKALCEEII